MLTLTDAPTATISGTPVLAPKCTVDADCRDRQDGWVCRDSNSVLRQPFCDHSSSEGVCICRPLDGKTDIACPNEPDGDASTCSEKLDCSAVEGQIGLCHDSWCHCETEPKDYCGKTGYMLACNSRQITCESEDELAACGTGDDKHRCHCLPNVAEECKAVSLSDKKDDDRTEAMLANIQACKGSSLDCSVYLNGAATCNPDSSRCECAYADYPTCANDESCWEQGPLAQDCGKPGFEYAACWNNRCGCRSKGSTRCENDAYCKAHHDCPNDGASFPGCLSNECRCKRNWAGGPPVGDPDDWVLAHDEFCDSDADCDFGFECPEGSQPAEYGRRPSCAGGRCRCDGKAIDSPGMVQDPDDMTEWQRERCRDVKPQECILCAGKPPGVCAGWKCDDPSDILVGCYNGLCDCLLGSRFGKWDVGGGGGGNSSVAVANATSSVAMTMTTVYRF